jgi:hypothetical protein
MISSVCINAAAYMINVYVDCRLLVTIGAFTISTHYHQLEAELDLSREQLQSL